LSVPNHADLVELAQLVEAGVLKPVIDRICAPHETAAALGYIEGGHVCGKIVVSLRA
jgi:NADPH:quinone reductase-like Zn-dependent oxidoreductase